MKVILGGGLGGLSTAYYLLNRFPGQRIVLYETSNRTGGWVQSNKLENNVIFEQSARTLRPRGEPGYNTLQLIDELGISDKIIPIDSSHPAAKNRMIYANGKLHTLPSSFMKLFKTVSPFTKPLIMHILHDLKTEKQVVESGDESIYSFVDRRFGREIAEYAISPLICGICAGNAQEISVKFLMKTMFDREQKYGSVVKGTIYDIFKNAKDKKNEVKRKNTLVEVAKFENWNVYSLKGGLETLPRALQHKLSNEGVDLCLNKSCEKIEFFNGECALTIEGYVQQNTAKHVISSLSAHNLADLVQIQHPELSNLLREIPLVDVCVINLMYHDKVHNQNAFGFLVPPSENLPILGVIFDSCCFPSDENTVMTVMMGGHWFKKYFGDSPKDENLLEIALGQIKNIMGIKRKPDKYKVQILQKCIPQYTVGHENRVNNIERYITEHKLPLTVCGASFHGVGVNDVIYSAKKVVDNLKD